MRDNNQFQSDKHLGMPEAVNREKHTDFDEVQNFVTHRKDSERQKEPDRGIEESDEQLNRSDNPSSSDSPMKMDSDDTIGVPWSSLVYKILHHNTVRQLMSYSFFF